MSHPPSRLHEVSSQRPCAVCGGKHKCAFADDGLLLCGRRDGPQDGFRHLGPAQNDPTWHLYRREDPFAPALPTPAPVASPSVDWSARAGLFAAQLGETARHELAVHLGLPDVVLSSLPVGYQAVSRDGPMWIFPERDGSGQIIGLQRRYRNGDKRNLGARGLCLPTNWQSRPGPIFCPEGASDTLALTALELPAVGRPSNSGGVNHLDELFRTLSAERQIVIVGERDERPNGAWPGRDGAIGVANELSRRLGRSVYWTLPPEPSKDVRAWVRTRDLDPTCADSWCAAGDELQALLLRDARPADRFTEFDSAPLSLDTSVAVPDFPVEVLPDPLGALVRETAVALNCPPDYPGVAILVLAGAALGNAWRLQLTSSHIQSAALFAALVGPPGSAKSPALGLISAPLHQANGNWLREHARQREENEELGLDVEAVARRCLVDDFTTESLAPILQGNPKGVVIVKDELAGLIHSLNQYKGGKGHDRQFLLGLWAGANVVTDRKSGPGPIYIHQPFVGIVGGIQPSILDTLRARSRQTILDDGLLDRFLFCYPVQPLAVPETWQVVSRQALDAWQGVVERLLALTVTPSAEQTWQGEVVQLSPAARQRWQAFTRAHADEVNSPDFPPQLQGVWSKMRGYAGRLALVMEALHWACHDRPREPLVDARAMQAAETLVAYFKAHARKVHAQLQIDPVMAGAAKVLHWLQARPGLSRFTRPEAYRSLRRHFGRPSELDEPLNLLAELRYLAAIPGQTPTIWQVNPLWYREQE